MTTTGLDEVGSPIYVTREEAEVIAKAEATRDLQISEVRISYVAFLSDFDDYMHCKFEKQESGWLKEYHGLLAPERLPGEETPDEKIVLRAKTGDMVTAVGLYRTKYGVGLREGLDGVKALISAGL